MRDSRAASSSTAVAAATAAAATASTAERPATGARASFVLPLGLHPEIERPGGRKSKRDINVPRQGLTADASPAPAAAHPSFGSSALGDVAVAAVELAAHEFGAQSLEHQHAQERHDAAVDSWRQVAAESAARCQAQRQVAANVEGDDDGQR